MAYDANGFDKGALTRLTFEDWAVDERAYRLAGQAALLPLDGRTVLAVDGGHARLGRLSELAGHDALTISFSFNRAETVVGATRLFWHNSNYGVSITQDRFVVTVAGADGRTRGFRSDSMAIENGVWTHVALTLDRSTGALRLLVDGAEAVSATGVPMAFTATARDGMFGGSPVGPGFVGMVDDFRAYAGVLSDERIADLSPPPQPPTPLAANPDSVVAAPGLATLVEVLANDAGHGSLRVTAARGAQNGTLEVVADGVLYTPRPGFFGEDRFSYVVTDAAGRTAEAEAAVTVGIVVRDAAELSAALRAARGGELILLAPGDYGAMTLDGRGRAWLSYAAEVTLRSLDAEQMARFTALHLHSVRNMTLESIHFDYQAAPNAIDAVRPFQVSNASSVTIRDSVFDGALAVSDDANRDGFGTGHGLTVRGSTDVTVEGNEFFHWHRGAVFDASVGLTVAGNLVHSVRSDGFNFAGVQDVRIVGNHFRDFRGSRETGDHMDMIQFWTNGRKTPNTDILIARNVLDVGQGDWAQSIFMRNEEVDNGRAGHEMFYRNVRIEENLIRNAHHHGITLGETDGLVIANNTVVQSLAAGDGASVHVPRINVADASMNVTVRNNIATAVPTPTRPDWLVADNLLVQRARPDAPNYYGDVFVDGLADHRSAQDALRLLPSISGVGASVEASADGPRAFILATPGPGLDRAAVEFRIGGVSDAAGPLSGAGASVVWDFGDGFGTTASAARHVFGTAGIYHAKATITLADGRRVEAFRTVEAETPVAILSTFEGGFADLSDVSNRVSTGASVSLAPVGDGWAARLAGGSDTIAFGRTPDLIGNGGYTVMLDYSKEAAGTGGRLVYFTNSFIVTLGRDSVRVDLTTDEGPGRLTYRSASLATTDWRHLAVTFDGDAGTANLFLDGSRVASADGLGALQRGSSSHDLHLGGPFGGGFVGLVDNFTFLRGALSDDQIAAYAASPRPASPSDLDISPLQTSFAAPIDPW